MKKEDGLQVIEVEESDLVMLVDMAIGLADEVLADVKNNQGQISQETIDTTVAFMQQLDRLNKKLDGNNALQ